uniref:Neurotransmitter-gated ion-channel ligand-binding domain-containing protein n=1 Tax=Strigamia maritima TaxID=126957 RepID=T1IZK6_STRMM
MGKEAKDISVFIVTLLLLILPREDAVAESSSSQDDINVSAILDSIQKGYDKRIRPNYGGVPVDVGVTMYIISISSLSEVQMDFTMDFYFRQYWHDNRLQFTARPGIESLSVGAEMIDKIWVPDTFFANEKSAYFHKATTMNSFLRFSATGDVLRSLR